LGISNNVGWPDGFAVWSSPLFGFGPYYLSLILGSIFTGLSVYQVYFLVLATGLALNATFGFWMVEKEFSSKKYPLLFGIIVGLSPFGFMNIGHMPVGWLFFPIVFLGVIFRLNRRQISRENALLFLVLTGIFSPLWWTIVVLFIAVFVTFSYLFTWKKSKEYLLNWIFVLVGVIVSLFPTLLLIYNSKNYTGEGSRFPWQSNVFGGRFSDLFLSSPFLNIEFSLVEKLGEGVSPEALINSVGFILGLSVLICVIYLLNEQSFSALDIPRDYFKLVLITIFFFISGGFGNLQAGIFVIFGQVSPARVWFRLVIILGLLGFFVFSKYIENKRVSLKTLGLIFCLMMVINFLDLKSLDRINFVKESVLPESAPTRFLDSRTKDCPVLQIPVDTYPLMQDFLGNNGSKFGYPQMIPYTLSSNNKWSLVGSPGNNFWNSYKSLPTNINLENINSIKSSGFCAIWFDKDFSTWQIERKAGLDFTQGLWPGLTIELPRVDFENERYQVYLLNSI
jgi:hypothetical protein